MRGAAHLKLVKPLRRLDQGDVLIVMRLDRLARSTGLLNLLDVVAAQTRAGFRSAQGHMGGHDEGVVGIINSPDDREGGSQE